MQDSMEKHLEPICCEACGNPFEIRRHGKRFCGVKCQQHWHYLRRKEAVSSWRKFLSSPETT